METNTSDNLTKACIIIRNRENLKIIRKFSNIVITVGIAFITTHGIFVAVIGSAGCHFELIYQHFETIIPTLRLFYAKNDYKIV